MDKMNKLLSDLNVMYVKLHTLHYNVVGSDFYQMHIALEGEYNLFHNWIDQVAESLKMENEMPVSTIKEMLEMTSVVEAEKRDYYSKEILEIIVNDYKELLALIKEIKVDASNLRNNLLEDMEAELVKKMWFFESMKK